MKPTEAALRADELLQDSHWIHRLARSLLSDPSAADDLVQEAWIAALAQDDAKRDEAGSPRSWLARVLHNLADKRRRGEARRATRELACARTESVASTADLVARAEMQRMVVDAVLELPEPYRTTVLLAHIEGLSSVEIARSQGVSDNTVRWRIQRGLSFLRFELERKRGREWLSSCVLLLAPADRAVLAAVTKGAGGGIIAAMAPKAAVAVGAVVLAGSSVVTWNTLAPSTGAFGRGAQEEGVAFAQSRDAERRVDRGVDVASGSVESADRDGLAPDVGDELAWKLTLPLQPGAAPSGGGEAPSSGAGSDGALHLEVLHGGVLRVGWGRTVRCRTVREATTSNLTPCRPVVLSMTMLR